MNVPHCWPRLAAALVALLAWVGAPTSASAQFSSGSSGADGALDLQCDPGDPQIDWDAAGFDADGDRVFEFTTITIDADCSLRLRASVLGPRSIHWLAQGDVVIDGVVDLSGSPGHGSAFGTVRAPADPGPGGFAGGLGRVDGAGDWTPGFGPGGGGVDRADSNRTGGGGGHVSAGAGGIFSGGGPAYGNVFALPLIGGSGGGGGSRNGGGGGGAGGGALLIASTTSITVNGSLRADGGGATPTGGVGSGGTLRLVAPTVAGTGLISASANNANRNFGGAGSGGRVRIETTDFSFSGTRAGADQRVVTLNPNTVLIGELASFPLLRIVSVGGQAVPPDPTGGFTPADVVIDSADPVDVEIEAENVPVGTVVTVEVHSEDLSTQTFSSAPLAGSDAASTATASVVIDAGFTLVTLRAEF